MPYASARHPIPVKPRVLIQTFGQKKGQNCPRSPWHPCCFCPECVSLLTKLMRWMWKKQLQGHLKLCVMLAAGAAVKRVLILTFFVEQPILLLLLPSCHEIPTLPERPKPPNCHFTQFSKATLMGPKHPSCFYAQFPNDNLKQGANTSRLYCFSSHSSLLWGKSWGIEPSNLSSDISHNPVGSKPPW